MLYFIVLLRDTKTQLTKQYENCKAYEINREGSRPADGLQHFLYLNQVHSSIQEFSLAQPLKKEEKHSEEQ